MARFSANEADHYGGQGGAGFFRLQNDMDVAKVRFMYNGIDDVQGDSVHQIEIDGKKRYVNCLRGYKDPVDVCPFCKEGKFVVAKLFIPVYNIQEDKVQIWERGKTFFGKMSGLCSRYPNLVSQVFEIERHGKAGDQGTTYEVFPIGQSDDTTLEDLPELPNIIGGFVLDKSADDMEYFLQEGNFPPTDDEEEERPVRRRSENREDRSSGRRTPSGRTGDRF